jgi:tetratricopeptide (TPR) repeat protein
MAKPSGIYWGIGSLLSTLLVFELSVDIGHAAGVPWLGTAGGAVLLVFVLLLAAAFYWLVRGGGGSAVVGAVMVRLYRIAFALPLLVHRGICWLRAAMGPGRDLFRGIVHLRRGQLEQAVTALERHLRRSPKDLAGLFCVTMALVKLGRYNETLRYLDDAVQRGAHVDILPLRCLVMLEVGAPDDALRDVEVALLRQPKNRLYHFFHAIALVQAGRSDEALEVLKGPASPGRFHQNWWPLSLALRAKGDTAAAADASCRALAFLSTMRMLSPMPWDETAEADLLARMGKLDNAEKATVRTLARNPGDHEALAVEALFRVLRGETEDAVRSLEQAGRRNPFVVVKAAQDPAFAPLAATPRFSTLLEQATRDWQVRLLAIRSRPGIAQSGA